MKTKREIWSRVACTAIWCSICVEICVSNSHAYGEFALSMANEYKCGYSDTSGCAGALPLLMESAANENDAAEYKLGIMYLNGWGVKRSFSEAARWSHASEKHGNRDAHLISELIFLVNGLQANYQADTSVKYKMQLQSSGMGAKVYSGELSAKIISAQQGNNNDQFDLGVMYFNGAEVGQSFDQALRYFELSAQQENHGAELWVGWMYQKGYGVPKNRYEAIKWYKKSAAGGNEQAKTYLNNILYSRSESSQVPSSR